MHFLEQNYITELAINLYLPWNLVQLQSYMVHARLNVLRAGHKPDKQDKGRLTTKWTDKGDFCLIAWMCKRRLHIHVLKWQWFSFLSSQSVESLNWHSADRPEHQSRWKRLLLYHPPAVSLSAAGEPAHFPRWHLVKKLKSNAQSRAWRMNAWGWFWQWWKWRGIEKRIFQRPVALFCP